MSSARVMGVFSVSCRSRVSACAPSSTCGYMSPAVTVSPVLRRGTALRDDGWRFRVAPRARHSHSAMVSVHSKDRPMSSHMPLMVMALVSILVHDAQAMVRPLAGRTSGWSPQIVSRAAQIAPWHEIVGVSGDGCISGARCLVRRWAVTCAGSVPAHWACAWRLS